MPSVLALVSLGLLLSSVSAIHNRRDTCTWNPSNQAIQSWNGNCYCCPGIFVGSASSQYCCAGGTVSQPPCFPFCSGSVTASPSPQSCRATIYLTDEGYSSKTAAYTSGMGGGRTAETTAPISVSSTSGGSQGDAVSSASSASSAGVAAALVTSGPLVGAWMVAGGLMLAV